MRSKRDAIVAAWTKCGVTVEKLLNEDLYREADARRQHLLKMEKPNPEPETFTEEDSFVEMQEEEAYGFSATAPVQSSTPTKKRDREEWTQQEEDCLRIFVWGSFIAI